MKATSEEIQQNLNTTVPYQAVRDEILRALPFPETKIVLDILNLPTEPIVSSAGVVNTQVGMWRGLGERKRDENHVVAKGDVSMFNGANLGVTYTRLRPFTLEPRPVLNNANDREFPNEQDRIAAQFVMTKGAWVSESRVGWNKTYLARLDGFLSTIGPNTPAEILPYGRRVGRLDINGLFADSRCRNLGHGGHDLQLRAEVQPRVPAASHEGRVPLHARDRGTAESRDSEVHLPQLCRSAREHSDVGRIRRTARRRTSRTWTTTAPSSRTTGASAATSC